MGSGSKSKKGAVDMGKPTNDPYLRECQRWCIRNNIWIAPKARSNVEWWVSITNKGRENISPETFGKTIIWQKIFEYCKYYYEKYRHTR